MMSIYDYADTVEALQRCQQEKGEMAKQIVYCKGQRDTAINERNEYKGRLEDAIKNFAERKAYLENEYREHMETTFRLMERIKTLEGALEFYAKEPHWGNTAIAALADARQGA